MVCQWSLPNYFASKTKNLAALLFFFSSIQRKIPAGKCDGYRVRWKWSTWRLVEDGMSMGLTNTHTARGFSDLYHMFTRKQCILCPALRHGCLTLLYVTLTRDFFYPWNNRPNSSYKILLCFVIIIPITGALRKDHAKFHAKNNDYCYTEIHFNIEENAYLQWNSTRQCLD